LLQKNELIEVVVTAVSHQGSGIARHEGMAVFIPFTAIGDRLVARVVKVQRSLAHAIIHKLLEPSPHRVEEGCPVFRRCGGCSLRHMAYAHEIEVKEDWVRENLARIGGVHPTMDAPIPSPRCGRYRNKAQYPVRTVDGRPRTGFYSKRSHILIPVEDCPLQPAFFADICAAVLRYMESCGVSAYDERSHTGLVRHLYLRHGEATGQVMVCLVVNGGGVPRAERLLEEVRGACPGLSSLVLCHNTKKTNVITGDRLTVLWGEEAVRDILCGVEVRLSPLAFYQVNRDAAQLLYGAALEYADPAPGDLLLDLYCGAGTIGLSMAGRVGRVVGVEVVPQAVKDARETALHSGIYNAEFIAADATDAALLLERRGLHPALVVLDPPRKGAGANLLESVARMAPDKVVYISCDSATLARDCKALEAQGYRVTRARAVDLFPRTAHVESVALLRRECVR